MVIDTSAIVAILFDETDADRIEEAISTSEARSISAASVLECSIVVESRFGEDGGRELDLVLYKAGISIVDVTNDQLDVARAGFRKFGKGRHRAGLNYGDCFAYALALVRGEPLLFKGDDFSHTDVVPAIRW